MKKVLSLGCLGVMALFVLVLFVSPCFFQEELTKDHFVRLEIRWLAEALETYRGDHGSYPKTLQVLKKIQGSTGEPYSSWNLKDPWSKPYLYQFPGTHNPDGYDLWTLVPTTNPAEKGLMPILETGSHKSKAA